MESLEKQLSQLHLTSNSNGQQIEGDEINSDYSNKNVEKSNYGKVANIVHKLEKSNHDYVGVIGNFRKSLSENKGHRSQPLLRKQPIYADKPSETSSSVTLDNPAILEQQLEALAYHKKKLEQKGLLMKKQTKDLPSTSCIPNLSSTSLVRESNTKVANIAVNPLYTNLGLEPNIYSNPLDSNGSRVLLSTRPTDIKTSGYKGGSLLSRNIIVGNFKELTQREELPLSPSPVSSSYSELRRATNINNLHVPYPQQIKDNDNYKHKDSILDNQTYANTLNTDYTSDNSTLQSLGQDSCSDYYGYGSTFSQASLTYESIYEPIIPRPPSELSARSFSTYTNEPDINHESTDFALVGGYPSGGDLALDLHQTERQSSQDEINSQNLTQNDIDNYGVCVKCNQPVLGETSGCTAMDRIYHISCFTCSQCQINLQGKPFYALDGKPYCEYDYLQTLEKCSVCTKPILERILRATGKPYHPQCFTCIICGRSLDGIPFTVDAANQNYCIADFHKKFAPRCCVCNAPIMPEPGEDETVRVVALDRSFHFECYKCEDCGLLLSSEAEGRGCYPLDDHVLCKSCNAERVKALTNKMTTDL